MADFKNIQQNTGGKALGAGITIVKQRIFKTVFTQNDLSQDTPIESSYLGTPIYDNVVLGSINDKSANNYFNILGEQKSYKAIKFNEVLMDVSMTKNIISTPIRGRNGTIKQYIGDGDYSILISGTISGKYNESTGAWTNINGNYFPGIELRNMIQICKAGYSIPVNSDFLNIIFGIDRIVITDYRLSQVEGGRYSQPFEINCMSDSEAVLEFTQEEISDSEQLKTILGV